MTRRQPLPERLQVTPTYDQRVLAESLLKSIDRRLTRWRAWFPSERSEAEVPREDLLALAEFAKIGLDKTR